MFIEYLRYININFLVLVCNVILFLNIKFGNVGVCFIFVVNKKCMCGENIIKIFMRL